MYIFIAGNNLVLVKINFFFLNNLLSIDNMYILKKNLKWPKLRFFFRPFTIVQVNTILSNKYIGIQRDYKFVLQK